MNKPFVVISPSEVLPPAPPRRLQRTRGSARLSFKSLDGETRLDRLFQSGAAKIRLPNIARREPRQAVLINSAGGLTGGDRLAHTVELGAGARAIVTTQACEKIYRSAGGDAEIATALKLDARARLDWLPQETILFDGARLSRRLEAELADDAILLIAEAVIFGRAASGETLKSGLFRDHWRIRRQGRLVFGDDLRFDWAGGGMLHRPAVLGGGAAMATILLIAPEPERHLETLRTIVGKGGGASAWDGKLLARIVAGDGASLRRVLVPVLRELLDGAALPRIWLM